MNILQRYNDFYNDECSASPWGSITSMENLQATAIRATLYAFARKYNMKDKIPVEDLKNLADLIEEQGNEFLKKHQTLMKPAQGNTKTDLDAL